MNFSGKRALITGGSAGIGKAIARRLGREGAEVVITGRSEERLGETARELQREGIEVGALAFDLSVPDEIEAAVGRLLEEDGPVELLVNNVGAVAETFVERPDDEAWNRLVRTNLDGPYLLTSRLASRIPDGGRIVFVSGVLGKIGAPGSAAYCATKHAIIGFARATALELAPRRITVNTVCPGWVDTDLARATMEKIARDSGSTYEEVLSGALSRVPLGELISPEEVASLVCFLLGEAGRNITGQAYTISGGQIMH